MAADKAKRSLALNVHFKHPDLGMREYEILSRATAFLLSVDPPISTDESSSPYSHIQKSKKEREKILLKQDYSPDPAAGPQRPAKDLGWLEFCPGEFRPLAHVVAASHVLSPWLWKNYYPQPWLEHVTQRHVRYSVSVHDMDPSVEKAKSQEPLATFGLNPYPIHHPNNMDLAIVHLKSEEATLKQMESLGVEMLHVSHNERLFEKDDPVSFEGFEITEEHYEAMERMNDTIDAEKERKEQSGEDDTRVFMPYHMKGNLIFASQDRFLAATDTPLPEGVCGGPVLDTDGNVCGVVEGVVPADHEEKAMAGAASFIPYFRINEFIEYAEKIMLEQIVPRSLFEKVCELKQGKALNETTAPSNLQGDQTLMSSKEDGVTLEKAYGEMIENIRYTHSPQQVEAIMGTVERERQEVLDMIDRDGGDLDEIIATVRAKTRERQKQILQELESDDLQEAEILSDVNDDKK